jgi:large subunit ribosomal protein L29
MAKKTKTDSVRDLSDIELNAEIDTAREDKFQHRFQMATGQLENTSLVVASKRQLARLLGEQRRRELVAASLEGNES